MVKEAVMKAAVALFVYNRPEHTLRVITALAGAAGAEETALYIFADGPKEGSTDEELKRIKEVRAIIRKERKWKEFHILESGANKGLANSIISGLNTVFEKHDRVIVLEDDIIASRYLLKYCDEALAHYEQNCSVMSVSAFTFPAAKKLPETFFLPIVACWGWATWKDRWKLFNKDGAALLQRIESENKIKAFNFNDSYDYYNLLKSQVAGKADSWAIRWYASIFLNDGIAVYPSRSLTMNIGMDGTGTHFKGRSPSNKGGAEVVIDEGFGKSILFNHEIKVLPEIELKFQQYLRNIYRYTMIDRIKGLRRKIKF
jgi:hypothetical protein